MTGVRAAIIREMIARVESRHTARRPEHEDQRRGPGDVGAVDG